MILRRVLPDTLSLILFSEYNIVYSFFFSVFCLGMGQLNIVYNSQKLNIALH